MTDLAKAVAKLLDYGDAHNWGYMPEGRAIEDVRELIKRDVADLGGMDNEPLNALVDRFLAWRLPKTVCSDLCVTDRNYQFPRRGTNLLNADEAKQMIEYLLAKPIHIDRQWCLDAAKREGEHGDPEIGAGLVARDPVIYTERNSLWIRILNRLTGMHWSNAPGGMGGD